MRIAIHLDRARLFRWHLELVERLKADGFDAYAKFGAASEPLPVTLTALLDFDRVRAGTGADRFSVRMNPVAFDAAAAAPNVAGCPAPDVTIDLATSTRVTRLPGRVLRPQYNGSPKDFALFHALLEGYAPSLDVADTATGGIWPIGLPALDRPHHFATSLDETASRLLEGLIAILRRIAAGETPPPERATAVAAQLPRERNAALPADSILASVGAFAALRASRKTARLRDKLTSNQPKWRVAWRFIDGGAPPAPGLLSLGDFTLLPDDGQRFYADPFAFAHQGARHLFVEELPNATGVGVVSHCTIDVNGRLSAVTPVLETGHHLSYPFVFERDGEVWLMPESSAAGGIDLYRAAPFPDRWTLEARLVEGRFHDSTLFEHDGLLWIAAGSEAFQSSTWDGLSLFWSPSLLGPWRPHARNPVLVDARHARPAGSLWTQNGELYRPAQDCSGGYGGKIAVQRITDLTPEVFRETTVGAIAFSADSRFLGPHTIGRAAGVEVIDVYARPRDLRAKFRIG